MAEQHLDDETLILLVIHRQPDALAMLYDRYSRLVYGLAVHITGDATLAEEITQDVFLRLWEHAASYRADQGRLGSWLAGVTRHRAIDIFRHQKTDAQGHSRPWSSLPLFDPPDSQNVEQELDAGQRNVLVRRALNELPVEQRDALALAYFRGHTQEEIAEILHEPLGTIKTRIRLGMQKLRKLLEGERFSA